MAHQTPQYPTEHGSEHLCDSVMVDFPFCSLFSNCRKGYDPNKSNDALDSITFPSTTAGPRTKQSAEEMQLIIDRLYEMLGDLSLLEKFREELEDLRENPPDMEEMNDTDRESLRLQDTVKMSARVITYWEEEWTHDDPQAKRDFPIMEKAAQLMGDLMEGIQDEIVEKWDGVCKLSIQRARIWLLSGAFDKNAPYKESYVAEVANDNGADDAESSERLENAETRFRCNQCPEAFNQAVNLEDHLRQNHGGLGVGKWIGKTLRHKIFGSLARGVGIKEIAENTQMERGDDPKPGNKEQAPASPPQLREGWLNVTPL